MRRRLVCCGLAVGLATTLALLPGCDCGSGATGDADSDVDTDTDSDTDSDSDCDTGTADDPGAVLLYDPYRSAHFFDLPFPNDDLIEADGTLALTDYPNPASNSMIKKYLRVARDVLDGFGNNSPAYFHFDGALNTASLPATEAASLDPDSSVFLVNVDRDSDEYGLRFPISWQWFAEATSYLPERVLAVAPMPGFPLRPATRYAVVITTDVSAADGRPLGTDDAFARIRSDCAAGDADLDPLAQIVAPLLTWLDEEGIDRHHIVGAAVFTTQDPVDELFRVRDYVHDELARPSRVDIELKDDQDADYVLYWGHYRGTNFQHGLPPYNEAENPDEPRPGAFKFDAAGGPVRYDTENLRFSLTVPKSGTMPAAGWPVMFYQHGTGGSFTSMYGSKATKPARLMAQRGIASVGIDQPLHGTRVEDPVQVELQTFNFINPYAGRTNFRQGAVDAVVALRFIREALDVPDYLSHTGDTIVFDPDTVLFAGHSQGGMTGALTAAVEPDFAGYVLSGAGGILSITLIERKDPVDFLETVRLLTGIPDEEDVTTFHPVVALVQMLVDETDMINYSPFWHDRPIDGIARNLLMTEGFHDLATPQATAEAMAVAARIPNLEPIGHRVPALQILGLDPLTRPVSGNVEGPAGIFATQALSQYPDDDHFAIFENAEAARLWADFHRSLVDGTGTLQ